MKIKRSKLFKKAAVKYVDAAERQYHESSEVTIRFGA